MPRQEAEDGRNLAPAGPLGVRNIGLSKSGDLPVRTNNLFFHDIFGTAGWTRTTDLLIHSQAL